jgi:hypothetical protein
MLAKEHAIQIAVYLDQQDVGINAIDEASKKPKT